MCCACASVSVVHVCVSLELSYHTTTKLKVLFLVVDTSFTSVGVDRIVLVSASLLMGTFALRLL